MQESPTINSGVRLALYDAAINCAREGALVTLTLRSGVQFTGKLDRPSDAFPGSVHMKIERGWVTIELNEIVAVQSSPRVVERDW